MRYFLLLSAFIVLAGCGGGGSSVPAATSPGPVSANFILNPEFQYTDTEVTSLIIQVFDGQTKVTDFGVLPVPDFPPIPSNPWAAEVPASFEIPVDTPLDFFGDGNLLDGSKIFTGELLGVSLNESGDIVTILMFSNCYALPADIRLLPVVQSIALPASIPVGTSVSITIAVEGTPNVILSFAITTPGAGAFTPVANLTFPASGTVTVSSTYTAPAVAGVYSNSLQITYECGDNLGQFVQTDFPTNVVP